MAGPIGATGFDPFDGWGHRIMRDAPTPTALDRNPPGFAGTNAAPPNQAMQVSGSIDSSRPGRRTNAKIQYARVMRATGDMRDHMYDDMRPHTICFVSSKVTDRCGFGVDRLSKIAGLTYVNQMLEKCKFPTSEIHNLDITGVLGEGDERHRVLQPDWNKHMNSKDERLKNAVDALDEWRFDGALIISEIQEQQRGELGSNHMLFNVGIRGPYLIRNGSTNCTMRGYSSEAATTVFDLSPAVRDDLFVCLHFVQVDATNSKFEYRLWSSRRFWRATDQIRDPGKSKKRGREWPDVPSTPEIAGMASDQETIKTIMGAWRVGSIVDAKASVTPNEYGGPNERSVQLEVSVDGRWLGLTELIDRYDTEVGEGLLSKEHSIGSQLTRAFFYKENSDMLKFMEESALAVETMMNDTSKFPAKFKGLRAYYFKTRNGLMKKTKDWSLQVQNKSLEDLNKNTNRPADGNRLRTFVNKTMFVFNRYNLLVNDDIINVDEIYNRTFGISAQYESFQVSNGGDEEDEGSGDEEEEGGGGEEQEVGTVVRSFFDDVIGSETNTGKGDNGAIEPQQDNNGDRDLSNTLEKDRDEFLKETEFVAVNEKDSEQRLSRKNGGIVSNDMLDKEGSSFIQNTQVVETADEEVLKSANQTVAVEDAQILNTNNELKAAASAAPTLSKIKDIPPKPTKTKARRGSGSASNKSSGVGNVLMPQPPLPPRGANAISDEDVQRARNPRNT